MEIKLQAKNIELTKEIHDYVIKRATKLEKLLNKIEEEGENIIANFTISKTTNHHKGGEIFKADCMLKARGENFFYGIEKEDLFDAIDTVKENLSIEIERTKNRKQTLFKRGALSVKKMMKGLSKRNPFTSKY